MKAAHDDAAPERVREKTRRLEASGFLVPVKGAGRLKRSFIIAMLETEVELVLL
jgi:hypothetical protein